MKNSDGSSLVSVTVAICCAGILNCAQIGPARAQTADDGKRAQRVFDVLANAQEGIVSARCKWTNRIKISKGSMTPRNGLGLREADTVPGVEIPGVDTTFQADCGFVVSGGAWKFSSQTPVIDRANEVILRPLAAVSSGGIVKVASGRTAREPPIGHIGFVTQRDYPRRNIDAPPFLLLRSLSIRMLEPETFVAAAESDEIEGRACDIVHTEDPRARQSLWVHCDRGVIARYTWSINGRVNVATDIKYAQNAAGAWTPSGWTVVELKRDGTLRQSTTAIVTQWDVNVPIEPKQLELVFPAGTLVYDSTIKDVNGRDLRYLVPADAESE